MEWLHALAFDGELAACFGRIHRTRKQLEERGEVEKLEELQRLLTLAADMAHASEIRARRRSHNRKETQ